MDLPNPTGKFITQIKIIPDALDGSKLIDETGMRAILGFIKQQLEGNTNTDNEGGTGNGSGGGTDAGGDNSGTFDYKTQCNNIDFPDPIPDDLESSINEAISKVSGAIDTEGTMSNDRWPSSSLQSW